MWPASCAGLPDGPATLAAVGGQAFGATCLGGFALLAKIDGSKTTWAYNSALWTTGSVLNPASMAMDQTEAKLNAFNLLPVSALRIGFAPFGSGNAVMTWLTLPFGMEFASLQAAMSAGVVSTSAGRAAWMAAAGPEASLQPNCNAEGLNLGCTGFLTNVRIGFFGNDQNDCDSPDSGIGFGIGVSSSTPNYCSHPFATFSAGIAGGGTCESCTNIVPCSPVYANGTASNNGLTPLFGYILGGAAPPPQAANGTAPGAPIAAYSVRKVVANYSGPLLSVRASGGPNAGALANLYPAATFAAGLAVNSHSGPSYASWIGSGTGFVFIWHDQSGAGQDASQLTSPLQPALLPAVGGLPGYQISFLNQTAYLTISSSFVASGAWAQYYLYSLGIISYSPYVANAGYVTLFGNYPADYSLRLWQPSRAVIGPLVSIPAGSPGDWLYWFSAQNVFMNGTSYFQPASPATLQSWVSLALSNPINPIPVNCIGRAACSGCDVPGIGNRNMDGAISELIFYSSALADSAGVLYSNRLQHSNSPSPPPAPRPPPPHRSTASPPPLHKTKGV